MRTKAITNDCQGCDELIINDKKQMVCHWGKSKQGKLLVPQKGKKPLFCNLKKKNDDGEK